MYNYLLVTTRFNRSTSHYQNMLRKCLSVLKNFASNLLLIEYSECSANKRSISYLPATARAKYAVTLVQEDDITN